MATKHLPSKIKPAKAKKAGGLANAAECVAKARMMQKDSAEVPGVVPRNPHY